MRVRGGRRWLLAVAVVVCAVTLAVPGPVRPVAAASAAAATATTAAAVPPSGGDQVPAVAFQVDAAHDGVARGSSVTAPLHRAWSTELGGQVSYPVAADGRVFVTVEPSKDPAGGPYGTALYGLDAATGAVLWGPVQLGGIYYFSSVTYDSGRLFATNWNGLLRAFDPASGRLLWSVQLPGGRTPAPITAVNGRVYASAGDGSQGWVVAVDELTGATVWSSPVNDINSGPAVDRQGVYVSYGCEIAYRFALDTGTRSWLHTTSCQGSAGATPVLSGAHLIVRDLTGSQPPSVLDAATGAQIVAFRSMHAAPVLDGDVAVYLTLDLQSGTVAPADPVHTVCPVRSSSAETVPSAAPS